VTILFLFLKCLFDQQLNTICDNLRLFLLYLESFISMDENYLDITFFYKNIHIIDVLYISILRFKSESQNREYAHPGCGDKRERTFPRVYNAC